MTTQTTRCKVVRTQRLTRIFCRIWLQPVRAIKLTAPSAPADQPFSLEQQTVEISAPSGSGKHGTVKRTYTMRKPSFDAGGNLSRFALDIVVHDNMARYGITGMGQEVPAAALANPMMANPMMTGPSIPMGVLGEDLAPGIIAAEDVLAGPGAAWAANAQVGDWIEVTVPDLAGKPMLYDPRDAEHIWLMADPAGLPMLQNLVASYAESESQVQVTIFAQTPHKADRYDLSGFEVFWALRGQRVLDKLQEKLPAIVTDTAVALPEYIWGGLEADQAAEVSGLLQGIPQLRSVRTNLNRFWTA